MTQTISRLFDSHDNAMRAATDLRRDRIWGGHVYVAGPADGRSEEAIAEEVMKGYVLRAHARVYAAEISRGGTLVTVHAPFGYGVTAAHVLNKHNPIDLAVAGTQQPSRTWDEAAPLSSAIGLPALIKHPMPTLQAWDVRPLIPARSSVFGNLGLPELVDSKESLSHTLRLPLLSKNPAPFSSLFRLPLLWRD